MTEPGTGSDLAGMRTTAVRDGEDYILNGAKTFITGGIQADLVIVVARTATDPDNRRSGLTLLVVEDGMAGFERGRELFDLMREMESSLGAQSFFIMDENFLLNRDRATELLDCMKKAGKSWAFYVFSSANALAKYTTDELVELGVSWVWMGLESPRSRYSKLAGMDTMRLSRELRRNGIKLLGSTIVGLEHHTPENIRGEIEHAVAHETDFHQFMLYTPVPGTPLYEEVASQGRLLDVDLADIHGQYKFNFRHPAITRDESKRILDWAFRLDFERNGPSLYRIWRTTLSGWRRHKNHPDRRVRERFRWEARQLRTASAACLWAMERSLQKTNQSVAQRIRDLRRDIEKEFGGLTRAAAVLAGPLLLWTARREERRLAAGKTYEPPTIIERRNWAEAN